MHTLRYSVVSDVTLPDVALESVPPRAMFCSYAVPAEGTTIVSEPGEKWFTPASISVAVDEN